MGLEQLRTDVVRALRLLGGGKWVRAYANRPGEPRRALVQLSKYRHDALPIGWDVLELLRGSGYVAPMSRLRGGASRYGLTPAGRAAVAEDAAARKSPILVVDDDQSIRDFLREALEFEGWHVVEATDGNAALELVGSAEPCVILLDMRMPRMNGWEFAAAYRARHDLRAPIVVMTAAQDAAAWAREVQADATLPKPFDLDAVYAVIRRFC